MANESEIFKIILKRGTTAKAQVYTGDAGEVVVDTGLKTLRVQDGVTPGGVLLAKSDHLHSFPTLENKPTTLSGYGITDAAPSSHIGATGAAHGVATTSVAGFMSATDKSKLDSITAGANTYTHPTSGATAGTYRSVTVDANGHVTAGTNPTTLSGYGITDAASSSHIGATGAAHGVATTSVAGFMSATDKSKLDGVASGANNYAHPTSGVTTGTYRSVTVDVNGHVTAGTNPTTLTGYGITDAVALSDVVTVASANKLLKLDSTGKLPASVTGSATTLQTPRTINGVSFDGSANITINAADSIARIASSEKGAANGVATLDGTGKVPTSQLPSFVDDVLESPSFANLPTSGVTGVLYLTVDTNQVYRWSGTAYVEISAGAGTADSAMKLSTARSISMTGDVTWSISSFDGSANVTAVGTLANSGVTAGVYRSVTVDAKGRVTAGANPTTLSGYGITDAAPSSHVGATGAAHGVATTLVAGFMSATDKSKLDGVAAGANAYTHPTSGATAGTYSSVTVDANGHVTAGTNPTTLSGYGITDAAPSSHVGATGAAHGVATTSVAGFMSATDKSKLDGVAAGANAYTHPTSGATAGTYRSVTVNANGHVTAGTNPTTLSGYGITDAVASSHVGATGAAHGVATTSVAGFMSATDKSKLDGVAAGANNYAHPTSSVTTGTYRSVTVDANGHVTAGTNPTTLNDYGIGDAVSSSDVVTVASANKLLKLDSTGKLPTSVTGSAATLQTARTINGVSFDGSANITINAADSIARIASSEKGAANGVATLDATGKVPASQLPSFVDDVLEFPSFTDLPVSGVMGVLYLTVDTNRVYRWSGSAYVEISAGTGTADSAMKLSTARSISMTGDVTWSIAAFDGSANVTATGTLANSGVTAGTYRSVTVDAKGRVTAGTNPTTLSSYGITDATPSSHVGATGAAHGVATTSVAGFMSATDKSKLDGVASGANNYTHPASGVAAGTYRSVTVDANGHVTAGTNPTTLSGYGITDAQPLHGDLTALAGLATTGLVVRTASGAAATRALSVSGTGLSLTNGDGVAGNIVITSNATSSNTASTVVARDASGGFSAGAVTVSGLGLSGTGGRITGNFSGAVFTDRTMFQTSTVNTATTLGSVPNGTGIGSSYVAFDKADPTNAAYLQLFVGSDVSSAGIRSGASGSGTPLPLKFLTGTGGVERVVIDAEGATAFKGGVFESKVALTAAAIDLKTGNMFTKTVTAATILSVVNAPASGAMASFILELTNGGAYAVTWWTGTGGATVKWAGGTAPSLTAAGRDVLGFYTHDGGVTWNGLVLGKDLK